MKKFILVITLFSSVCKGQDFTHLAYRQNANSPHPKDTTKWKHFLVSVNAGMAIPYEEYASTKGSGLIGSAMLGFHSNVEGGVFLTRNFALVAKAGLDLNNVNLSAYSNAYGEYYKSNGGFIIQQYMIGLYLHFTLHRNTFLNLQAVGGEVYANYPTLTVSYGGGESSYSFQNALVPGGSLSVGFEETIFKNTGLAAAISYTTAQIKYPVGRYTSTYGSYGTYTEQYTPQSMSYGSLQITAGVNFHL